jgi:hypothetical protein
LHFHIYFLSFVRSSQEEFVTVVGFLLGSLTAIVIVIVIARQDEIIHAGDELVDAREKGGHIQYSILFGHAMFAILVALFVVKDGECQWACHSGSTRWSW